MRIAIFSDVHGNLEALDQFVAHSRRLGVEGYACLGDSIGYGPNPNECLEKIKSLGNVGVVLGNHEWAALNLEEAIYSMNPMAYDAISWTQKHLTVNNKKYISSLKLIIETGASTLVHASAFEPQRWEYLISGKTDRLSLCMESSSTHITFVGHTHRPMIADSSGHLILADSTFDDGTEYLDDGRGKLLVNPGSIGQPRDSLKKPCYVIMDTCTNLLTWRRINDYDPSVTARKILETQLPAECAYYLTRR